MIIAYILMTWLIISTLGQDCDDIFCAHIFDEVCGMAELKDGTQIIMKYQNICYLRKKECQLKSILVINQIADELCNIKKPKIEADFHGTRRLTDYSIMGAHQACNHTCPTFCTDTYDPACAQIWHSNELTSTFRPMVNHCHIDLFSCSAGLNVTIMPISKCYRNPTGLLFMQQVAALKSLRLLDDHPSVRRRADTEEIDDEAELSFKQQLEEVVRKIFNNYRNRHVDKTWLAYVIN